MIRIALPAETARQTQRTTETARQLARERRKPTLAAPTGHFRDNQ